MKKIERGEVMGLADYETIREQFRARVLAEKRARRVALGPKATVLFENRDTVLLQIQEMLRTERITRPGAVDHEIETYNELVPGDDELSCTLMIEIPDKDARDAFLTAAKGLEEHVGLMVAGERVAARGADRGAGPDDRTTAVHYLKFALPPSSSERLRRAAQRPSELKVELLVDHPAYQARCALPAETVAQLGQDLAR